MSARDGAVSLTDKHGYPIGPKAHQHYKGTKSTPCCKRLCRCAAVRSFECQACSRDRHRAEEVERNERNRQAKVAGR